MKVVDAIVVIWAVVGAHLIRFGFEGSNLVAGTPYVLITVMLPCVWWLMLDAWGSRQPRIMGSGPDEYKRVFAASIWLFGALAIVSYALQIDLARGYVGIAFPLGAFSLIAGRWVLRQHLGMAREKGSSTYRLLVVGGPHAADHLIAALRRFPKSGYTPVGAYLHGRAEHVITSAPDLPIFDGDSTPAGILDAVHRSDADAVALTAGVHLPPTTIRQLGWELAAANIGLIVAPALTDIAGPRIHTQQVAGLPLIHVTTPKLEGGKRVAKRLFDVVSSGTLLIGLSPLLLIIALFVKLDSQGSILFKQERIGILGTPFLMFKFRSMGVNAEQQLSELQARNEGSGLLFKLKADPRVTRVGAVLRRYSLDELPQLLNVFSGSMSLVGPRPPLTAEVDAYEEHVRRRLLVKPGVTGLWQVSGRSNLSWQESVRLDLYYVENWSMTADLVILFRTLRAVLKHDGAY